MVAPLLFPWFPLNNPLPPPKRKIEEDDARHRTITNSTTQNSIIYKYSQTHEKTDTEICGSIFGSILLYG